MVLRGLWGARVDHTLDLHLNPCPISPATLIVLILVAHHLDYFFIPQTEAKLFPSKHKQREVCASPISQMTKLGLEKLDE